MSLHKSHHTHLVLTWIRYIDLSQFSGDVFQIVFQMQNSQNPHEKPPNFKEYLEAMVAFSKHESLVRQRTVKWK